MKAKINLDNVYAVCDECAHHNGFTPKNKVVGVWEGECEICHKHKHCTSLWHDWKKEASK